MKQIDNKNSLLSLSSTQLLRVVFETLVLIHHLYLVYTSLGAVITNALGPIAVGGFIFLSGFGVGLSYIKKGDEYAEKAWIWRSGYEALSEGAIGRYETKSCFRARNIKKIQDFAIG